ncbi:hypothetical protein HWV62_26190 [Athelia sp. TMB]|nr:hypothetical protein HWV62_26190 [Athelia sp. TMB]
MSLSLDNIHKGTLLYISAWDAGEVSRNWLSTAYSKGVLAVKKKQGSSPNTGKWVDQKGHWVYANQENEDQATNLVLSFSKELGSKKIYGVSQYTGFVSPLQIMGIPAERDA